MIIDIKPKLRIRKYNCYYCDCTGIITNKRVIFQILDWGYQYLNKKICHYCNGRGYVEFKHKYTKENNFQSFLEH